jgi:hypothetical protein
MTVLLLIFLLYSYCFSFLVLREDLLNVVVNSKLSLDITTGIYEYHYSVKNLNTSAQAMRSIVTEYDGAENPNIFQHPDKWNVSLSRRYATYTGKSYTFEDRTPNGRLMIQWSSFVGDEIKPGNSQEDFVIKAKGLPAIVNFFATGRTPPRKLTSEEKRREDAVLIPMQQALGRGDEKEFFRLEKQAMSHEPLPENPELGGVFNNSFQGKILGPIDPPDPFEQTTFIDTIISYVTESGTLDWISSNADVMSIKNKLTTTKDHIGTDNDAAISTLDTLLTDLETKHGTTVNDEAYYLIKFNVMYLKKNII